MWCVAEGGWGRWKEGECWPLGCVLMAPFSYCPFPQVLVHSSDAPCCLLLPIHFGRQCLCGPPATSAGTDPLPARSCPAVPARAPTHPGHSACCCQLSYRCSRGQAKVGRVTQQNIYVHAHVHVTQLVPSLSQLTFFYQLPLRWFFFSVMCFMTIQFSNKVCSQKIISFATCIVHAPTLHTCTASNVVGVASLAGCGLLHCMIPGFQ